jgi:signal transduction histidine kinase
MSKPNHLANTNRRASKDNRIKVGSSPIGVDVMPAVSSHPEPDSDLALNRTVLKRQLHITVIANLVVFIIGLAGFAGIILDRPTLYDWDQNGLAMNIQSILALLILSVGYFFHTLPKPRENGFYHAIATACYTGVLIIGLTESINFLIVGQHVSIEAFLVMDEPLQGRITFYASLGYLMASSGALVYLYLSDRSQWVPRFVQLISIVLITMAAYGIAQSLAFIPILRFFIPLSSSVGLFLFGLVLLFYPHPDSLLTRPFFSTPLNRVYALGIILIWLGSILWLSVIANTYLPDLNLQADVAADIVVFSELVEIILAAAFLGLSLLILGTLDRSAMLTHRLQESFDSNAMLAATLSHDLKAPIQSQVDVLQMIQSSRFGPNIADERNQHMLSLVLENNLYEMELVQNLVEMLRYDINQERYSPQPLELNPLLYQIKEELSPIALRKGHRLYIHPCPEDRQRFVADSLGLKRVLHNLINNAITHIGRNGIIEVQVQPREREKDYLFSVHDNGPGISKEAQDRLFSYRDSAGNTSVLSTTGLGLYISRRIIQRHGGNIWLESSPETGTTFFFTLPQQPLAVSREKVKR